MEQFDTAADQAAHERQQRLAALTPPQRQQFDRLLKNQERRKAEFQKYQTASRESSIEEDARRRLLRTRNLALRPYRDDKPVKHHEALQMAKKTITYENDRQLKNLDRQFQNEQQQFLEHPSQTKLSMDFKKAHGRARTPDDDLSKRDLTKSLNRASLHRQRQQEREPGRSR